ncbi:DUF2125 domain-containing protein [Chenggangzhangella methanolivorans]|uniref:DUF2125 domain-containing protein n=1 Tax=Chenggangzhangella methanolivorans TaxID=1437009 RepID=A0A9E6RCS0_9HYPH|nr:DUF2125 domain-containing protein [Chenggangzhangella methanolivorans]QZO01945.1 DUF2125 domain-containing protein [Chenggangzhangella methanolivorans]
MTDAAPSPGPRRGRWRLFAPTLLLLVGCAAWTGFWFWAAGRAGEAIDVWLAREAKLGRTYACGGRDIQGFPFRIEVDCRDVSVRLAAEGGEIAATAPRFVALAQVYDPKRLIGILHGPVAGTAPDGTRIDLSFSDARGSARVEGRTVEQASLRVETPRLTMGGEEVGTAKALEAHLRRAPDAERGTYDLAAALEEAVSPFFDAAPVGSGPVAAELQIRASGLEDLHPGSLPDRLRRFAEAGGRARVDLLKISRGDVAAEAKGEAQLDVEGRANGRFDVTARGVDSLVQSFAGEEKGGLSSLFGVGAKLLGKPAELDGKPATTYRLKLDKGRLSLGPIRLTRLPPAF